MSNVITGDAWKPYRGVMPSLGSYRGIWNWDSAFHAVGISHWDPELAREQFKILFGKQLPSGALPDVIWEKGGMVTTFTKPPVMAWAVAVVDRRSPDIQFLQEIYPKLIKLGDFWLNERGGAADGLFYYAGTDTRIWLQRTGRENAFQPSRLDIGRSLQPPRILRFQDRQRRRCRGFWMVCCIHHRLYP